jgi:hypothetical protein
MTAVRTRCRKISGHKGGNEKTEKVLGKRFWHMEHLKRFEQEVSAWGNISVHPHRFGGREFRFGSAEVSAEVGHVHTGGVVDIPFPRSVRDALLAEGLAVEHRWVPNSGWTTFQVRTEADFRHAVWLLRLSYLRYAMKTAANPRELLEQQSDELRLRPRFRSLLEPFLPVAADRVLPSAAGDRGGAALSGVPIIRR